MKALLNYFIDLCLLRAGPQNLPASSVLLILLAGLNICVGLVMIADARMSVSLALGESLFETLFMLGVLFIGLKAFKKTARFLQSGSALMGCEFLMGLMALPLVSWSRDAETNGAGFLLLGLVIWSLVVMGHILRHTLEISLASGIGIALLYTLFSWNISFMLFPVTQ